MSNKKKSFGSGRNATVEQNGTKVPRSIPAIVPVDPGRSGHLRRRRKTRTDWLGWWQEIEEHWLFQFHHTNSRNGENQRGIGPIPSRGLTRTECRVALLSAGSAVETDKVATGSGAPPPSGRLWCAFNGPSTKLGLCLHMCWWCQKWENVKPGQIIRRACNKRLYV